MGGLRLWEGYCGARCLWVMLLCEICYVGDSFVSPEIDLGFRV